MHSLLRMIEGEVSLHNNQDWWVESNFRRLQPDRPIIEKGPIDRGSFRPRVW